MFKPRSNLTPAHNRARLVRYLEEKSSSAKALLESWLGGEFAVKGKADPGSMTYTLTFSD